VLALLVLDQCALSCVHFVTLVALENTLPRLVGASVDAEVASLCRLRLPLFLLLGHKTFKVNKNLDRTKVTITSLAEMILKEPKPLRSGTEWEHAQILSGVGLNDFGIQHLT
jgi:hypothetical protein